MSAKSRERWTNWLISFVTAITAVVIGFTLSSNKADGVKIDEELKEKADITYVDDGDAELGDKIDEKFEAHDKTHLLEEKINDVQVKYQELMMDEFKIDYRELKAEYNDLKDQLNEGR